MRGAILPFLGYCVIQLFVLGVGLNVVRDKRLGFSEIVRAWLLGQATLFALLQALAVPLIVARRPFDTLFWSYLAAATALFALGCRGARGRRLRLPDWRRLTPLAAVALIAAAVLIALQCHRYFFKMHLDEDDARWLAQANDALEYGQMMTRSVHTGEYLGYFEMLKDVTSPWPMLYAILSRLLRVRTAVVAHTLYPPVEVFAIYGAYWLIGSELFEKLEARLTFLMSVAIINLYFGGTVYTQAVFSMVRVWQGKATVAAVAIPLLTALLLRIHGRDATGDWLALPIVGAAASLMSGMGITMSTALIGAYGAYDIVFYRRWRRIPLLLLALAPSLASGLAYAVMKG